MQYEIITRTAEATFAHKKVIGGGGEFAIVSLRLEPLSGGSGVQFMNDVADKVLPARLVEGVQEGIQEASKRGVIAGHPVTNLRVTLIDGKYHEVDFEPAHVQSRRPRRFLGCDAEGRTENPGPVSGQSAPDRTPSSEVKVWCTGKDWVGLPGNLDFAGFFDPHGERLCAGFVCRKQASQASDMPQEKPTAAHSSD